MQDSCTNERTEWPQRRTYLPRLSREHYKGDAVVLWTLTMFHRATGWLTESLHDGFREVVLHALARETLVCPIYCLMPDHIHLVWMGLSRESDQFTAMAFLRTHLQRKLAGARLQSQSHDHVLRKSEHKRNAFAKVCAYVGENPVRANLVTCATDWQFTNCVIPGYPDLNLFEEEYWPKFWRIYSRLKEPEAGRIPKPPFKSS